MQQGKHRKGELKGQHDLAEREQIIHTAVAANSNDEHGRDDCQRSGNESSQPGLNPPVHEAFHHHLSRQRASDGAALSACQQGHDE